MGRRSAFKQPAPRRSGSRLAAGCGWCSVPVEVRKFALQNGGLRVETAAIWADLGLRRGVDETRRPVLYFCNPTGREVIGRLLRHNPERHDHEVIRGLLYREAATGRQPINREGFL